MLEIDGLNVQKKEIKMDNFNLPQEKLDTLKDELRHLLNRLSIDNELGTPDFILAEMITEQINSMVVAKRKTLELAGESLKTTQLEIQGIDDCYMNDSDNDYTSFDNRIKELLKKIPNSNYSNIHEEIITDLHIVVLNSFISSYIIAKMYNHVLHSLKNQKGDATEVLNRLLYEISNYCENFDFTKRHKVQERIRTLSERLNSKSSYKNTYIGATDKSL